MTRFVSAAVRQAENVTQVLANARKDIIKNVTTSGAITRYRLNHGLTPSPSVLQRWLKKPDLSYQEHIS